METEAAGSPQRLSAALRGARRRAQPRGPAVRRGGAAASVGMPAMDRSPACSEDGRLELRGCSGLTSLPHQLQHDELPTDAQSVTASCSRMRASIDAVAHAAGLALSSVPHTSELDGKSKFALSTASEHGPRTPDLEAAAGVRYRQHAVLPAPVQLPGPQRRRVVTLCLAGSAEHRRVRAAP